jgi:hypothetical protein
VTGGDPSTSSGAQGESEKTAAASSCTLPETPAATKSVTFLVTNERTSAVWIPTHGHFCSLFTIERDGKSVPQVPAFQCLCECANPGPPRADEYRKVEAGGTLDLEWMPNELVQCKQAHDCAKDGWPAEGMIDEWISARQALADGPITATIAFEPSLPYGCLATEDVATCQTAAGWTPTREPVAPTCASTSAVSVELTLPTTIVAVPIE